ncbi:MAG: hybrid sensor histidine kinase/response regulator [Candidatus Kapaibacterium sp.]|nr:MAG: hybrid sensor histidine kinase/response regulator [Candidatus Kapabacteria bacterium]
MRKILVIDDTDFIREDIATTLQFEGFETITAEDGLAGVEMARSERPDLILCDVSMPRLDGFGALEQIRKIDEIASIPFIFLTAKAEKADMRRGMELGASDYLTKPFTTDELIEAVNAQFRKLDKLQVMIADKVDNVVKKIGANIGFALPHEFRTPLVGIIGGTDMIDMVAGDVRGGKPVDAAELESIARDIRTSTERLRHLTENFIAYTQLQNLSFDKEAVRMIREQRTEGGILGMIEDIFHLQSSDAGRLGDVSLSVEDSEIAMAGQDIYKIIQEVASNALKFSKPGTTITVEGKPQGKFFTFTVIDKGCGIKPDDIPNLGSPFAQFDRMDNEQQGAGLGLAIVKKLLELYQGVFNVQSVINQETTITIQVPVAPEMA